MGCLLIFIINTTWILPHDFNDLRHPLTLSPTLRQLNSLLNLLLRLLEVLVLVAHPIARASSRRLNLLYPLVQVLILAIASLYNLVGVPNTTSYEFNDLL
jgi:hypothetical protein